MVNSKSVGIIAIKFIISIVVDLLDLVIGVIPIVGTVYDVIATGIAVLLWGRVGLLQAVEIAIPGSIDGFVPTVTLAGILSLLDGKMGKKSK